MSETIVIAAGGAGTNISAKLWESLQQEQEDNQASGSGYCPQTFFHETSEGLYRPRSVMVDTDPIGIDQAKESLSRLDAFDGKSLAEIDACFISGFESSECLFPKATYEMKDHYYDTLYETIQKQMEACDRTPSLFILSSLCGGAGSGISTNIVDEMDLGKVNKIGYNLVVPDTNLGTLIEPFNCIFGLAYKSKETMSINIDNTQCTKILNKMGILDPTFDEINSLISTNILQITAPLRYKDSQISSFEEIIHNTCSHLGVNKLTTSFAPFVSQLDEPISSCSIDEVYKSCFGSENNLALASHAHDPISVHTNFLGDVKYQEATETVLNYHDKRQPNPEIATKYGLATCKLPQIAFTDKLVNTLMNKHQSCCMLVNSKAIAQIMDRINTQCLKLYSRRATSFSLVGAGLEEGQITEAWEILKELIDKY
ncbi:unnamed protein product [Moneuplotes crassus]|uniref:Tubulin/FtsZ GTPase domain-containing protein n=1 Tax=Euplotes crassus TaxID=5936 RepID=A0AAD1U7M9_EUPCR|nr:unnamed protein product [Moneuplotes crassus]